MLYSILSRYLRFPLLGYILNSVYYSMIVSGILVSAILFYKRLAGSGYPLRRLRPFFILSAILVLPLGIISSRAANMFYYSPSRWNVSFFWDQFLNGPHQTFHAAIILPLITIMVLAAIFQIHVVQVFDTLLLYLPLGHAIGRGGCLLVGCCYGNPVTLSFLGRSFSFDNPVPLYAIFLNLSLFYILRHLYIRIYSNRRPVRDGGRVAAWYLIGYAGIRFVLETIRKEKIVAMGMTQAQWTMILFFLAGLAILAIIELKKWKPA